ncbi:hypothetical protein SADUNF_Sadunf03G0003400 [Salix dunnii]|uniref:Uncharacterized protein n=1 Tax=Salix dunnii TaxID=1413687 RepID=A0A835KAH3_9ROSI|nr:hypothetical protein SADUNF_Sadunf03G0003400 [Salix dunnii]
MKAGQSDKTKVVVRHLPPGVSQPMFVEQIDAAFSGRYNWLSFRPGKSSQKHQSCSRAYINFKRPDDVIDFAEFFNGHLFVNEKGTQFKATVEYAPSQHVPKQWSKKDGREGTILKDPEYLEFLEFIAKPVENLPSAEIQLERRDAERAGTAKDAPIVTPLMDFIRLKRAAKSGPRRILSNGKLSRRAGGNGSLSSSSSKRGSEKKRASATMYVLRDTAKGTSGKEKSTHAQVPKRDHRQLSKAVFLGSGSGTEVLEEETVSGVADTGKKKILLLKGKEKEISLVTGITSQQQSISPSDRNITSSTALKSQRHEASGKVIRSILLHKDSRRIQSSGVQSDPQMQTSNLEKDKHPPRPPHALVLKDANGTIDDNVVGNDLHGFPNEQERRTRNKDRPDRVVWTLRRSDGSYASDESLSSSASLSMLSGFDSSQGKLLFIFSLNMFRVVILCTSEFPAIALTSSNDLNHGDVKADVLNLNSGEVKVLGTGRSLSSLDNGSHKHFGRRGPSLPVRDTDGSNVEGKTVKRGGASGYGSHEVLSLDFWMINFIAIFCISFRFTDMLKACSLNLQKQVWVQKQMIRCEVSEQWRWFFYGKPRRKFKVDISDAGKPEADVVVIGSGIGGLCCAGLLARYQQDVLVLESHDLPGGAAHSFEIKGYKFDSGPSLFSGFQSRGPQANPLAQVLDALGESVPCVNYDSWMVYVPEGEFLSRIGPTEFYKTLNLIRMTWILIKFVRDFDSVYWLAEINNYHSFLNAVLKASMIAHFRPLDLEKYAGPNAMQEWKKLLDAILPLSSAAMALPPLSIRGDFGVLSTAAARYAPSLLKSFLQMGPQGALGATKLLRPFSEIVDSLELKDPFIRNWVDLLAFLLAGVKSNGILSAEMIYMFAEWYKPGCSLEYPLHGTGAVVDALVRGLQKFGGRLSLRSHVEEIVVENNRATGVKLRSGQFIRAKKAVISNASMWDTSNLLPKEVLPKSYLDKINTTPQCESFMHLHLGFDAECVQKDLGIHHIVVNDWSRGVDADQNVVLISVPSVLSPVLAPPGKHLLHAYTPGTEPFELWEGLDRRSSEYKQLKAERSEVMWRAVERALGPGFSREKCEVKLVGTPLTHKRFLRRNRGTYGPAIEAGKNTFPGHSTPISQLYCCGDSTFPGIGVPAVAASGAIVANTLVSVSQHSQLLDAVGI